MNNWFEVSVSYEKLMENGMEKKVTEKYLIDALSHTEAEARAIEEVKSFISGGFTIAKILRKRIAELFFFDGGDRFWQSKIEFVTLDEKSGAEKRTSVRMLAQASDVKEALAVIEKGMEGTMADYWIGGITETAIMDVFPYNEEAIRKIVL